MVRAPIFDKNGVKKGAWSEDEDNKLRAYIKRYGHSNWRLSRCGKSCRLRWLNYLQPNVKHGDFTKEEEEIIADVHNKHGNKWSMMAARLPGRSDNEIKNHWHTHLKNQSRKNHTTMLKNEEIGNVELANPKRYLVEKPNFRIKTQQEVGILLAVLSSDQSPTFCSKSHDQSSACSLSISDYAVSSDGTPQSFEPADHSLWNDQPLLSNKDGVVSSSYNMFSPLRLDDALITQATFPDYVMDVDVPFWPNLDLL